MARQKSTNCSEFHTIFCVYQADVFFLALTREQISLLRGAQPTKFTRLTQMRPGTWCFLNYH